MKVDTKSCHLKIKTFRAVMKTNEDDNGNY